MLTDRFVIGLDGVYNIGLLYDRMGGKVPRKPMSIMCLVLNTSENSDLTHDVRKKFKMSLQVNYGTNDKRWFLLTDLGMTILYEPNKLWKKHVLGACTWLGKVLTTTEKQKIHH